MSESQVMERTHPLEGRAVGGGSVTIRPAAAARRISLRVPAANIAAVSKALGVDLPKKPKTSVRAGARSVLWLGPDEWLVIEEGARDIETDLERAKTLYAAVDISHRNTAIIVSGAGAADVLSAGCPQDLSLETFPAGACSRTVLGKIEIVLYRTSEHEFRVEVWRSFAEYAFAFLAKAAANVAG